MPDAAMLLFALPPARSAASAALPDAWWWVEDARIIRRGTAADWPHAAAGASDRPRCIAIAPAADSAVRWLNYADLTLAQASAAARIAAPATSAAAAEALHIVAGDSAAAEPGRPVITTTTAALHAWIGYAVRHGMAIDAIIPAALIAPPPTDPDTLSEIALAGETVWRGTQLAMVADPAICAAIAPGATVVPLSGTARDAALVAAATNPPADLRSGAFAPAAAPLIDPAWLRRAAILLGVTILLSIGIAAARIIRFNAAAAMLDDQSVAAAAAVLGTTPPIERALADLDARLAQRGAGAAPVQPLAALIAALEPHAAAGLDSVSWRGDGTLTVTLGAPRADDINPVLIALQAAGYRITAQPRTGSDGRALGDITVRSTP